MEATMVQELGRAITQLWQLSEDWQRESSLDASGDCGSLITKAFMAQAKLIANVHGYDTVNDLINAAEARTSPKWVWESGIGQFDDEPEVSEP